MIDPENISACVPCSRSTARWSVVIPYFNEEAYLQATLASLSAQMVRPFHVILVDNGSTDRTAELARAWAVAQQGIRVTLLSEPTPGQVHALAAGVAAVDTEFLAICDADTLYPPGYLEAATARMDSVPQSIVGFIAHDTHADPDSLSERAGRWLYTHVVPNILRNQAHGGGYAHLMRTAQFRASGGYSAGLWPYVLKDHELAHRLTKQGEIRYATDLWVRPSDRRADRNGVRWTLFERILYHLTPPRAKDWFFYGFLRRRFVARGQQDTVLRKRSWVDSGN